MRNKLRQPWPKWASHVSMIQTSFRIRMRWWILLETVSRYVGWIFLRDLPLLVSRGVNLVHWRETSNTRWVPFERNVPQQSCSLKTSPSAFWTSKSANSSGATWRTTRSRRTLSTTVAPASTSHFGCVPQEHWPKWTPILDTTRHCSRSQMIILLQTSDRSRLMRFGLSRTLRMKKSAIGRSNA